MNSRELFDRCLSATSQIEDFNRAYCECEQILQEYAINHCAYERKIKVFNSELGTFEVRNIPCGKCHYCRETKRNEWVTRMWLHTKYGFKHCYFITLDYSPISRYENIPEKLLNAAWHLDSFNSNKRLAYHPCLVRIEHLQLFFRQLRDDLRLAGRDFVLSYYSASEYGKRYGRPHHHFILWSNSPIYKADIQEAWTIRSGRRFQSQYPIGRVDFNDLNENGTICSKGVMVDNQRMSAKNAFKYVCKYMNKGHFNDYRPFLIYKMYKQDIPDLMQNKGRNSPTMEKLRYIFDNRIVNSSLFQSKLYEYTQKLTDYSDEDYCNAFLRLLSEDYKVFRQLFKPFNSVSNLYAIGKVYIASHVAELAYGRQEIVDSDLGRLVFPSYFQRKIKDYINGLSLYHKTTKSETFVKGNRKAILHDFSFAFNSLDYDKDCQKYVADITLSQLSPEKVSDLLHSEYCLRDSFSGLRYLIVVKDNILSFDHGDLYRICPDLVVCSFSFNKKTKQYDRVAVIPISVFIDDYINRLNASFDYFVTHRIKSDSNKLLESQALSFLDCVFNSKNETTSGKFMSFSQYLEDSFIIADNDNYAKFNSQKL